MTIQQLLHLLDAQVEHVVGMPLADDLQNTHAQPMLSCMLHFSTTAA